MPVTERSVVIAATPEQCFATIADYERYPEFLDEMSKVSLNRRESNYAVATFELDLMVRVEYTLRLFEDPPHGLHWSLEHAKIMRVNTGSWKLSALDAEHTQATYRIELELRGVIPESVTARLAGTTLPRTLQLFKQRIEANAP